MTASTSTFFTFATETAARCTGRRVTGAVASGITAWLVTGLCMAAMQHFLWWWLAALMALLVGMGLGGAAGMWAESTGYDAAVSACAWIKNRVDSFRTA